MVHGCTCCNKKISNTSSVQDFNSLAPGRPSCHFKTAIFNLVLLIGIFTLSNDNALRWMPRDLTDDKSTLVQVMAWCRQATSHYLSQCWPNSMSTYGVTRPQWVKSRLVSWSKTSISFGQDHWLTTCNCFTHDLKSVYIKIWTTFYVKTLNTEHRCSETPLLCSMPNILKRGDADEHQWTGSS